MLEPYRNNRSRTLVSYSFNVSAACKIFGLAVAGPLGTAWPRPLGTAWPGHCMAWAPGHCMAWVLHGLGTAWPGYCMAWVLHGLGTAWPGHCMAWALHGLGTAMAADVLYLYIAFTCFCEVYNVVNMI